MFSINKMLLPEDGQTISEQVKKDFFDGKLINRTDVSSKNDDVVLGLSMIFDLNFDYSFEYLIERNLLWRIYDNINDKERFQDYFEFVDDYIHERVNK